MNQTIIIITSIGTKIIASIKTSTERHDVFDLCNHHSCSHNTRFYIATVFAINSGKLFRWFRTQKTRICSFAFFRHFSEFHWETLHLGLFHRQQENIAFSHLNGSLFEIFRWSKLVFFFFSSLLKYCCDSREKRLLVLHANSVRRGKPISNTNFRPYRITKQAQNISFYQLSYRCKLATLSGLKPADVSSVGPSSERIWPKG